MKILQVLWKMYTKSSNGRAPCKWYCRPEEQVQLRLEGLLCPVNSRYWILDIGYWILYIGYWILDTGYWLLDFGYWILDIGYWILDIGCFLTWHTINVRVNGECIYMYI